jgi:hypothetical protein
VEEALIEMYLAGGRYAQAAAITKMLMGGGTAAATKSAQFPVLFPRNGERDRVRDENRRDLRRFLTGGWLHNSLLRLL